MFLCTLASGLRRHDRARSNVRPFARLRPVQESKFWDVTIGPNMYQVNESHIQPLTRKKDPCHGIPCLSYALHCNSDGLSCDLFVSHAWSEGIFELSNTVVQNWPDGCIGAYICSLANPQNLPELMSHMIETPSQSPFFRAPWYKLN